MSNFSRRQLLIINELFLKSRLTSAELALAVDASVRTVKTDIATLKSKLAPYGITIESRPNIGYELMYQEKASLDFLTNLHKSAEVKRLNHFMKNNYERVFYMIRRLFFANDYIKLDELANDMFISRSTLNGDMIEVKKLLKKYQLKVVSKANYGIMIQGTEINKRLGIAEFFFHNRPAFEYKTDQESAYLKGNHDFYIRSIEIQLRSICEEYQIVLSDFSLKNIAIHVFISIQRNLAGCHASVPDSYGKAIRTNSIYAASQKLCQRMNELFGCRFQEADQAYIYMHLESKQIKNEMSGIPDQDQAEVELVLEKIFAEIKNNFDIDISKDETVAKFLALHIPQMVNRIKNNMVIRNPVVHENLQKYIFATKVTISAAAVIQDHYGVTISLDEFGYLLLYFNLALMNLQKKKKVTIGLMSGRGRAETIMYINEIKENFSPEYECINYPSIDEVLKHLEEIDILVSSYSVELSRSILQVAIENGNYIERIREYARKLDFYKLNMERYFQPQYSAFQLEGDHKESILRHLVEKLRELEIIDSDVQMEMPFVAHEIGNNIVHLQDLYKICRKPFCFIAVLKNPIIWDKDVIRVLFMIKTKRDGDHDLNILCDMFSKWTRDKEKISRLINGKNYEQFLQDIQDY
ncbi:BglG family transcription antiterminator [Brevibacillus sp. B_LB10_24]|uniref:BglG family transcription antiterminator n=1 Tax=Brevibacillus sp. B_LB10_24 TaxID=3380645 RepID=UPI0038BBBB5E